MDTPVRFYAVSEPLINKILEYLGSRPYTEVVGLCSALIGEVRSAMPINTDGAGAVTGHTPETGHQP